MQLNSLPDIIRRHVMLDPPKPNGWCSVACKVCHDHTKKGKRAAFRFDGDCVGYNCFNCSSGATYDPSSDEGISDNMIKVLESFGVPKSEWEVIYLNRLVNGVAAKSTAESSIIPATVDLLPFFYPLTDDPSDEWAQYAIEYLRDDRMIDYRSHPFYLSKLDPNNEESKRWFGRLIIPVYKDKNVIFWQGRDLGDTRTQKYISVDVSKDNVISDYDILFRDHTLPLYVTEGWFDAKLVNGVCVFGPKLSPSQIKWLERSPRQKVIIPDKKGDGQRLANQAIALEWCVSTPDIGSSCKDVTDAFKRYGAIYTLKSIRDNTACGPDATTRVNLYCERSKRPEKNSSSPKKM